MVISPSSVSVRTEADSPTESSGRGVYSPPHCSQCCVVSVYSLVGYTPRYQCQSIGIMKCCVVSVYSLVGYTPRYQCQSIGIMKCCVVSVYSLVGYTPRYQCQSIGIMKCCVVSVYSLVGYTPRYQCQSIGIMKCCFCKFGFYILTELNIDCYFRWLVCLK